MTFAQRDLLNRLRNISVALRTGIIRADSAAGIHGMPFAHGIAQWNATDAANAVERLIASIEQDAREADGAVRDE